MIRNGEWVVENDIRHTDGFLAVVGVLTNRFHLQHVRRRSNVDRFNIELKYEKN